MALLMTVLSTPVEKASGISTASSTGTLGVKAQASKASPWMATPQAMSFDSLKRLVSWPMRPPCTMTDSRPT